MFSFSGLSFLLSLGGTQTTDSYGMCLILLHKIYDSTVGQFDVLFVLTILLLLFELEFPPWSTLHHGAEKSGYMTIYRQYKQQSNIKHVET